MRRKLLLFLLSWFVFEMLVHRGECDSKLGATRALGIASSFSGDKRLRRNSIFPKQKAILRTHVTTCPTTHPLLICNKPPCKTLALNYLIPPNKVSLKCYRNPEKQP
jgi:hypothetical protein